MISRVTVLLPFVPETDTIGMRRSASRIHSGGVVRAASIRSVQRASSRSWAPVSWAVRDGETSRSASASAASLSGLGTLRADPREGDDPVARIGRAMDGEPAAALAVVGPQPPDPGDGRGDRHRASRGPARRRRAGRARAAPDRAGRTRSAAGRWRTRA